jgi:hypothetical protein
MNHVVPAWVERLLGINTGSGEGTVWSIDSAWPWPPWVTLLLAALAVVFVAMIYWREGARVSRRYRIMLAALRLAILGVLLLMIAQVTLSLNRTGLPYAAVLIDDSLSMTIVDHYAEKPRKAMAERLHGSRIGADELSRWNLLRTLTAERDGELLRGIAAGHKLRVYFVTGSRPSRRQDVPGIVSELRSLTPKGEMTRLGAGVRAALDDLRGAAPAAVVVLTDGINTDGPTLADAAEHARRRGVPLYFVGLGSDRPVRDLKLSDLIVDDVVFVDDVVNFECKLTAAGFEGRKVLVVLREKNKPATPENILAKTEVTAPTDDRPLQVRLQYRPTKVGQFEYVVEAQPLAGESSTKNNRQTRVVQVRREKIRVLLAYGYPSFEFRYLRNMLRRDETIALDTVLQDADPESAEQDASSLRAFPLRREDLFAYDVVIFGDVNPALLNATAMQNLADFVDQPAKGGSLVLIAGPSYMPAAFHDTPLARLLPFAVDRVRYPAEMLSEGFVVQPTDLGLASPAMQLGDTPDETARIWKNLPPLYWLLEVPEVKPGVRVLAEHPTRTAPDSRHLPVFLFQYVGAGKVLFHATDETWRWRYRVGDLYFARYWIQTIRYLCRSKLADGGHSAILSTDRREYPQGESVRLRVRFADERLAPTEDDGVTVVVEQAGRKTQRMSLHRAAAARGLFEGVLDRPATGSYHAWIAAPTLPGQSPAVDFTVILPPGEFAQVRMDAAAMRSAAEISGGRFYTFDTADRLLEDLPPGHQVPIESVPPRPLWNRWPVLALFLVLLIAEWILRKRRGMV